MRRKKKNLEVSEKMRAKITAEKVHKADRKIIEDLRKELAHYKYRDQKTMKDSLADEPLDSSYAESSKCSPAEQIETQLRSFQGGFNRKEVKEAFHLICPELERRLALICSEGLANYRDVSVIEADVTTARFPAPLDNLIRHMKRHFNMWLSGDRSEDHLAKVAWGIQQIMHQEVSMPSCQHINIFLNNRNKN